MRAVSCTCAGARASSSATAGLAAAGRQSRPPLPPAWAAAAPRTRARPRAGAARGWWPGPGAAALAASSARAPEPQPAGARSCRGRPGPRAAASTVASRGAEPVPRRPARSRPARAPGRGPARGRPRPLRPRTGRRLAGGGQRQAGLAHSRRPGDGHEPAGGTAQDRDESGEIVVAPAERRRRPFPPTPVRRVAMIRARPPTAGACRRPAAGVDPGLCSVSAPARPAEQS